VIFGLGGCGSGIVDVSTTAVPVTTDPAVTSATTSSTSTTAPPTCSPAMKGVECKGGKTLKQASASSPDECCDICAEVAGCVAWTFTGGKCRALDSCPKLPETDDEFDGTSGFLEKLPESYPIPDAGEKNGGAGRFQVAVGRIDVTTFKCLHSQRVSVFYPKGPGPFHAVVYSHGYDGGADNALNWMHMTASMGLVTLVPWAHSGCDSVDWDHDHVEYAYDLLEALNFSKMGGASLHPVFGKVDWSATGIFGHSRGARMTPWAASLWPAALLNVKAFVASHGGFNNAEWAGKTPVYNITMPAMFTTGTVDTRTPGIIEYFGTYKGEDKVFVDLTGGHHMEPTDDRTGALNAFDARFLACHLAKNKEDCDYIYGDDAQSLCQAIPHPEGHCIVPTESPVLLV